MLGRMVMVAASVVALSSCAGMHAKPVVALPNGYYLQPDAKGDTELVKRNGRRVLPGPIAAYTVSRQIVTGALGEFSPSGRAYANDLPFQGRPDTRYFVLDTVTGRLDGNLDASAWRRRLDEVGAPQSLQIYAPLPWS